MTTTVNAQDAQLATQSVAVDGIAMRVRIGGLAHRAAGQPVIVFESGASLPLETWDPILPAVAGFAPVVAYDRSGTGQSAWDSLPPTPERVGSRLWKLLERLEVPPPYILVGHSWGGALVRFHAAAHPADVAGILYIDPTDITLTRSDLVALFESIGSTAAEYDAFNRTMQQQMARAPAVMRAESDVILALIETAPERRGLAAPAHVPASVILAGRIMAPPRAMVPFDGEAYAKAMQENRVARLRTWVSSGGRFDVAGEASHFVHVDAPQLVIDAIRTLVETRHR